MNNNQLHKCFSAIRSGDKTAFESLYNDMKIPVFTIICRIVSDKTAAEDVMQDLFVKLYCSPPSDEVKNIRAWIFKTAHNLAIDSTRKPELTELREEMQDTKLPLDDFIGIKYDIEKAMWQLSKDERIIVSLHINANLKFREVAEVMNIPIGTAIWRYQKAINKLKTNLSGGTI